MSGGHLSKAWQLVASEINAGVVDIQPVHQEFFELVKSIGESRSKQEEDKIIVGEIAILKQHLSAPNISAKKMKDFARFVPTAQEDSPVM